MLARQRLQQSCAFATRHCCRQKSKDIEVDLWRFEVPPQTDG